MRARPGRLRISVSQAFQLRPELLPEIGEGLADYHGDAATGDDDPGGGAQDALAEAAQAPSFPGRRLHQAPAGMNHFVGEYVEQENDLVVGEGIDRALAFRHR